MRYLRNKSLSHNEEQVAYIGDIQSQEEQLTFEAVSGSTKNFSKSVGKVGNMVLKIKRCWADGYQQLLKYSDARKIYVERTCLADLKIGYIESVE